MRYKKDISIPKDSGIQQDTAYICAMEIPSINGTPECRASVNSVRDALYVLSGKWKLPVIAALRDGPKRFNEIQRALTDVTPKVLSKELRELELNELVKRKVYNTVPVTVIYELTDYSETVGPILGALREWGMQHRERIKGSMRTPAPATAL